MSSVDHSSFLRSLQARMRVRGASKLSEETENEEKSKPRSSGYAFHYTNEHIVKCKETAIPTVSQERFASAETTSSSLCNRRLFQWARGQEVDITCGDSTLGSYTIPPLHRNLPQGYSKQSAYNSSNHCKSVRTQCEELNHVQSTTNNNTDYSNSMGVNNNMRKATQSRKIQTSRNTTRVDRSANDRAHVGLQTNLPLDSHIHKDGGNKQIKNWEKMHLVGAEGNRKEEEEKGTNNSAKGSRYTIFPFKQQDVIDNIMERYCAETDENVDKNEKESNCTHVQYSNACFDTIRTNENVENENEVVALTHPCSNTTLPAPPIIIHYHFANQTNTHSNNNDTDANASTLLNEEKTITTESSSPLQNVQRETAGNMISVQPMHEDQSKGNTSTSATYSQLETSHIIPGSISVHPASSPTAISTMEPLPPSSAQVELTSTINTTNTNIHKTENTDSTSLPAKGIDSKEDKHESEDMKDNITATSKANTNDNINKEEKTAHFSANDNVDNGKNDAKKEQMQLTSEQEREAMLLRNASRYVQSLENKIDAQMTSFESHIQLLNEESARNALLRKDRDSLLKLAQRLQGEKAQLQRQIVTQFNQNGNNNKQQLNMKNKNVEEDLTNFIASSAILNTSNKNPQSYHTRRRDQNDKHTGLNFSSQNSANSHLSSSSQSSQDHKLAKAAESNATNLHKYTKLPDYTVTAQPTKMKLPLPDAVRAVYEITMQEKLTCANTERTKPQLAPEHNSQQNNIYHQQQQGHKQQHENVWANAPIQVKSSEYMSESKQNMLKDNAIDGDVAQTNNNKNNNDIPYDTNSVTRAKERLSELEKYVDQLWREAQMTNESRSQEVNNQPLNYTNHNINFRAENTHNYKHAMPHSVFPEATPAQEVLMSNRTSENRNNNEHFNNLEGINTSTRSSVLRSQVEPNRYQYSVHSTPNQKTGNNVNDNNRKYKHFAEVQQLLNEIAHERAVIRSETEQWHQYLQHTLPSQTMNIRNVATSNL